MKVGVTVISCYVLLLLLCKNFWWKNGADPEKSRAELCNATPSCLFCECLSEGDLNNVF